jgi:hypothetical protein
MIKDKEEIIAKLRAENAVLKRQLKRRGLTRMIRRVANIAENEISKVKASTRAPRLKAPVIIDGEAVRQEKKAAAKSEAGT